MDFSDPDHSVSELVFQGADRHEPAVWCDEEILTALRKWSERTDTVDPATPYFKLPATQCFSISYDGKTSGYWPDETSNWLNEGLVRDFLFHDGICVIEEFEPRLYEVRYKVQALADTEYLLVCPYRTAAGNIGGIVVVCVTRHAAAS